MMNQKTTLRSSSSVNLGDDMVWKNILSMLKILYRERTIFVGIMKFVHINIDWLYMLVDNYHQCLDQYIGECINIGHQCQIWN